MAEQEFDESEFWTQVEARVPLEVWPEWMKTRRPQETFTCVLCQKAFRGFPYAPDTCEMCGLKSSIEDLQDGLATMRSTKRRLEENLRKEKVKLHGEKEKLATEREGLLDWLHSRRGQQQQLLDMGGISGETKRLVEVEIGLIDRYTDTIRKGQHRNAYLSLPGEDTPFQSSRDIELAWVIHHVQKCLDGVRNLKGVCPQDPRSHEGAEHALLTIQEQFRNKEHRPNEEPQQDKSRFPFYRPK